MSAAPRWRRLRQVLITSWLLAPGCNAPIVQPPPPPLRAASVNALAVEVEFPEALDRASAENPSHFVLYPAGNPAAPVPINSATLVDTFYGRVVQLLVAPTPLPDNTAFTVEAYDVRTLGGKPTGQHGVGFTTGLNYEPSLRQIFARSCNSCHDSARTEGNYRTDTYGTLFGTGSNSRPNLIAGNPNCLLVVKTKPGRSMFDAGELSYLDSEMIRSWVVNYQARP